MTLIVTGSKLKIVMSGLIGHSNRKSKMCFLILFLLLTTTNSFAQAKYFEVVCKGDKESGSMVGFIAPVNKTPYVQLNYKGKSKAIILKAVLDYLKNRPALKLNHISENQSFLVYRDFANICDKTKCRADLVALSHFAVIPEDGYLSLRLNAASHIYATINDAKLRIGPDDVVVSDNDVPFNELKLVQPGVQKVTNNGMYTGFIVGDKDDRLAYPESVFDQNGKVVNPTNKEIIEKFYNGYVEDLKSYLDTRLKL